MNQLLFLKSQTIFCGKWKVNFWRNVCPRAPSTLYVRDRKKLKFSPFSHNPPLQKLENHVKSSFHDYCYRHFCLRGVKCFGLISNIRKIIKKCSFLLLFQKNSS